MTRLIPLFLLLAITTFAADLAGTWKGTAEGPNGAIERTFVFKVDGSKLTGEASSPMFGKSVIENGKVEDGNISFSLKVKIQDNEMTINYTGKHSGGDTLTLSGKGMGDMVIEYKCKKQ
ncbi:MAG: hypothetical protein HY821_18015 [Acidobacteria bacterium]|nr:hypothetical protein [Acidobacteriota bacterium]